MAAFKKRLLLEGIALISLAAGFSGPLAAQDHYPKVGEKLVGLSAEQREFLESDDVLRILPSRARLNQILESRSPEEVQQFVSDMMASLDQFAFNPDTDMAAIPMNKEANTFNRLVREPPALWELRREPGPLSVHRYVKPQTGIPTFAGAPVAFYPEDLIAGQVDVAIAGVPQSMSSGNRDARNAPGALRAMHGMGVADVYTLTDVGSVLNLVDYGDISVDRMSMELSIDFITGRVAEIAETGTVPFLVGGDRSVTYATVRGVTEVMDAPLTLVQLGAHYDARPTGAHTISDRDPVYRLLSEGLVEGGNLIQLGLRGPQADGKAFEWLRNQGVRYHTMAEVERNGWKAVMEQVLDEAKETGEPVYISLDVSVLDPSQLRAAGRAVSGGLTTRELLPLLRRLCAETQVVGFELMDLAPMLDLSYVSALNANAMMNACLSGMALRKMGIDEENYLDPLALDHGQD